MPQICPYCHHLSPPSPEQEERDRLANANLIREAERLAKERELNPKVSGRAANEKFLDDVARNAYNGNGTILGVVVLRSDCRICLYHAPNFPRSEVLALLSWTDDENPQEG